MYLFTVNISNFNSDNFIIASWYMHYCTRQIKKKGHAFTYQMYGHTHTQLSKHLAICVNQLQILFHRNIVRY